MKMTVREAVQLAEAVERIIEAQAPGNAGGRPDGRPEMQPATGGLLNANQLLKAVWPNEESRPSLGFLKNLKARRLIPYVKLGRRVFFDADQVRAAIDTRHTIAKLK